MIKIKNLWLTNLTVVNPVSLQITEPADRVVPVEDDVNVSFAISRQKLSQPTDVVDDRNGFHLERVSKRFWRFEDSAFVGFIDICEQDIKGNDHEVEF